MKYDSGSCPRSHFSQTNGDSCSVSCYKTHKPEHELQVDTRPVEKELGEPTKSEPKPAVRSKRQDKPRFADLEKDEALSALFKQYPDLRVQLQNVYALMLEPDPDRARGQGSFRGRGGGPVRWTRQRGEQEAQALLRRLREEENPGVVEFIELIASRSEQET